MKKHTDTFRTIGLVGHVEKPETARIVRKAAQLIAAHGGEVRALAQTAQHGKLDVPTYPDLRSLRHKVDLLLVFGGDGTMLGVARQAAGSPTPILGINVGGLGFLTAVPSADLSRALAHLWRHEFRLESRALLQAEGECLGQRIHQTALNDFVVGGSKVARLIELEVCVNGEPLTDYRCDGLIVSTPTGSTAYSLAAGGAVVYPTAKVLALTPISPHTLSNRSLILPSTAVIQIRSRSLRGTTVLSGDGQSPTELDEGDVVVIRQSRRSVRLVHLAESSFFGALRHKLHWRGAYL